MKEIKIYSIGNLELFRLSESITKVFYSAVLDRIAKYRNEDLHKEIIDFNKSKERC